MSNKLENKCSLGKGVIGQFQYQRVSTTVHPSKMNERDGFFFYYIKSYSKIGKKSAPKPCNFTSNQRN